MAISLNQMEKAGYRPEDNNSVKAMQKDDLAAASIKQLKENRKKNHDQITDDVWNTEVKKFSEFYKHYAAEVFEDENRDKLSSFDYERRKERLKAILDKHKFDMKI